MRSHRIVPESARSGLWISPYLDNHFFDPPGDSAAAGRECPLTREWHQGNRPTAIRLLPNDLKAVAPGPELSWEIFKP